MSLLRRAKPLLGTLVEVSVECEGEGLARAAIDAAFGQIATIQRLMSFHDPESDLSRLNRAPAGVAVMVDPMVAEVLRFAARLARESEGAFDCSVGSTLVALEALPAPNSDRPVDRPAETTSGYCVKGSVVVKSQPCWIDLGGIAKGYAVDRAIEAIRQIVMAKRGSDDAQAVVNAGGDLRHFGPKPIAVGIRAPAASAPLTAKVKLANAALASSATAPGEGFSSHAGLLVDERSGTRLAAGLAASVMAPTCMVADALTKVVLVTRNPDHRCLSRHDARCVHAQFDAR
ncbi:MAG: thiamine biosynthesis lipoprotein ApbE [Burkholderiaceae bacterium]|jgi:thiamine biosynthesis lipoprotein|nr:MAG: thiamine biosynthesis lipoprotein ApbE [Burkholderiaceae bacterium]